jgi:two-component system nitrogen regulation response regulator GlnG/two-component system response regulator HydG
MSNATESGQDWSPPDSRDARREQRLGLLVAWARAEGGRVGEIILGPRTGKVSVFGRGEASPGEAEERAPLVRIRQGVAEPGLPLEARGLSRRQIRLTGGREQLEVERIGKLALRHNGKPAEQATLRPGDVLTVDQQLVLFCVERQLGPLSGGRPLFDFGEPDPFGLVGESPRIWLLREELAFFARRPGHALILGPSGTGKELCARALHRMSPRAAGPFVARNAATLPSGLIDAELFGNIRNFPNIGMPERPGLAGEASGGTLFLDEIGELPEELQAHLLRLLDSGEYHRLGDGRARRTDLRFVAATNRDERTLKYDLAARLPLRIAVPGLEERREDIPLLVRALLRRIAAQDPSLQQRFFEGSEARIDPGLVEALLVHEYTTHMRELEMFLLLAMAGSAGPFLALTSSVEARLQRPERRATTPGREEIEEALLRCQGNVSQAWKDLGLSSRDALYRLLRKHSIPLRRP